MFDRIKFKKAVIDDGKTMADVAKYLGINEATLYRKLNGSSEFSRDEIQQICTFLHLDSPMEIFFAEKLTKTQEN
ncbi:MAG: helix-turn-helix transcriptional regulator [Eubacteriales bacterium]|nr:helix-turn-helix transcriptional regulator [Eubacteriales bacterium]